VVSYNRAKKKSPIMTNKKDWKRIKPKTSKAQRRRTAKKVKQLAVDIRSNGGRPSTYDEDFARQARKLCSLGATDADLADHFGVTTSTIWMWATRHQEFFKALHEGKGGFDDRVKRGLAQRGTGYSYDSEKVMVVKGKVVKVPIREHVPPDPRAAMDWLTNRDPMNWKRKIENGFDPDTPLTIKVVGGLPK
jgi:hypothetical protein